MKKYCLVIWIILVATSIYAGTSQIYKWTDDNGNVHFSDKTQPGAVVVELPKAQTFSPPTSPKNIQSSNPISDSTLTHYDKVTIVQPEDQATIRNAQGVISVILAFKPKLRGEDKVQMILDGSPLGFPQAANVFALQDINRGSHTLAAQIVDMDGNVLNTSELITIYMMPPRVGMVRPQG